jgi:hypothetical protein
MNEPVKKTAPSVNGAIRVSSVPPRPVTKSPASTARKVAPRYLFEPSDELDVTADVVADGAASLPSSGMLKVSKATSTPPPLPGRAVTTPTAPSPAPSSAPRIVSVPPTALSVEGSKELRALIGEADRALSTLSATIREMDRRLGELENKAPENKAPESGDPVRAAIVPQPPASDLPWDGTKRRRQVALALIVSAALGLTGLLSAMACSYAGH